MNRRLNGFGSLICKGDGKPWLARWVYKGQVFYKSTGEPDKNKALKVLEQITRPFREQRAIDVERNLLNRIRSLQERATKTKLPIDELWNVFAKKLKHDDVEDSTAKVYEGMVCLMVKWMKKKVKLVNDITPQIAEEYLEHLSESVGAASYNIRLVLFKRIWKSLQTEYQLCADTWENFKKKKVTKSTRRTVNNNEIGNVITKAKTFDMKLLLTIGLYTGLRLSDCALLKWNDIDFEHKVIHTIPIKTKKHMDAPIAIPIHPTLMKMLEDCSHESEFISEANAKDYKLGHLSGKVVSLFKSCGITTSTKDKDGKVKMLCSFHSLRHTFISQAINNGMSPLLVQKIVGHSAVNMTSAYFHENSEKMTEGINALPDIM